MRIDSPTRIDNQQLAYFPFYKGEVLQNQVEVTLRNIDLDRALRLGNLYKSPVIIYFKSSLNETKMIHATVWALTEKFVEIKGGNSIPIRSITKILV